MRSSMDSSMMAPPRGEVREVGQGVGEGTGVVFAEELPGEVFLGVAGLAGLPLHQPPRGAG